MHIKVAANIMVQRFTPDAQMNRAFISNLKLLIIDNLTQRLRSVQNVHLQDRSHSLKHPGKPPVLFLSKCATPNQLKYRNYLRHACLDGRFCRSSGDSGESDVMFNVSVKCSRSIF